MPERLLAGLAFLAIGGLILVAARPIARLMADWAAWQVSVMRRPWFVWYYRFFGAAFVLSGACIIFLPHS